MRHARLPVWGKLTALSPVLLLSGCSSLVLFHPKGQIGSDEKSLIITAAILMLIVVVPVIIMAIVFARRYRASNTKAKYTPEWEHSRAIEIVVWAVPIVIVAVLGTLAWVWSHRLDPYHPIASEDSSINIQVVSMDWKWLFIYPKQGIATVNEIKFPANVPVHFYITSEAVMNSFFIPQLGSQIMSMPGMQTQLYLEADRPGDYRGISANYSGAGFSGMSFKAVATRTDAQFRDWVEMVKASPKRLDESAYEELAKPSRYVPVEYFSSVKPNLFHDIIMKYAANMRMSAGS